MALRPIALVLLAAYASAAAHLLVARHASGEAGEIIEAAPACARAHGSSGISHGHGLARDEADCGAIAVLRAGAPGSHVASWPPLARHARCEGRAAQAFPPVELLHLAPKASPPV